MSKRNKGRKRTRAVGGGPRWTGRLGNGTADGALKPVGCPQCGNPRFTELCYQCRDVRQRAEERAREQEESRHCRVCHRGRYERREEAADGRPRYSCSACGDSYTRGKGGEPWDETAPAGGAE